MAKALKRMIVAEYEASLEPVDGLIVFDPGPMTVEMNQAFRRDLRERAEGAEMRVIHNRTARIALRNKFYGDHPEALDEVLTGPSAILFGGVGPIGIARVLREWKRKFKPLRIKGGVSEGEVLGARDADGLADLPNAEEMRAILLSAVSAPARGLVGSLAAVYGGIARVLQAHIDEEGGPEAPAEDGNGDGGPGGE